MPYHYAIFSYFWKTMEALYQKIEIEEERLFITKSNITPYFDGLYHFHPEYELTYINKGKGRCFIGDKFLEYKEGDLFLIGPNLPHSWRTNFDSNENSHSLVIQLNHHLWKGPFFSGKELSSLNKIFDSSVKGILFRGQITYAVSKTMFKIHELSQPMERLTKLIMILDELSNCKDFEIIASPAYHVEFKQNDYQKINKVYNYVHVNFTKNISLEEISNLVNMTNSGFCRYFKKVTRRTFISYLNEYRIGVACRLLNQKDLNITEIGFNSGFQSISNFNKQFKSIMGFSPREYKNQLKGS